MFKSQELDVLIFDSVVPWSTKFLQVAGPFTGQEESEDEKQFY